MTNFGFWAVVPALITLVVAFATRRVIASVSLGIIVSALIVARCDLYNTLSLIITRLWVTADCGALASLDTIVTSEKLCIFGFLLCIGALITLIGHSGGAYALGNFMVKRLDGSKGAETSSLILSSFLGIDDYFSSFTVGAVMQPLTDRFSIPRVKLAFLVDSLAAPLCAIFPISSWAAAIVMQCAVVGINDISAPNVIIVADPFLTYLKIIPFTFHALFIIGAAWFVVRHRISFGLMAQHEEIALTKGNVFGGKMPLAHRVRSAAEENIERASLVDFLAPLGLLLGFVVYNLLDTGGWQLLGGTQSFMGALANARCMYSLLLGAFLTLLITFCLNVVTRKITSPQFITIVLEGIGLMVPTIRMLILAWTLGSFLRNDLGTGQYLIELLPGALAPALVPVLLMLCAAITAFCIGSAWGTMAILFPIAVPMLTSLVGVATPVPLEAVPLLLPTLGAIISGAVLGDHISPIADVTVMASGSAGAYHMDFIYAQFGYVLPVAMGTTIAYLLAGYVVQTMNTWCAAALCLVVGFLVAVMGLSIGNWLHKRRAPSAVQ